MLHISLKEVLPSFIPAKLGAAVAGYEASSNRVAGEKVLDRFALRSLLVASTYLGTVIHVIERDYDFKTTRKILSDSLGYIDELTEQEKAYSLQLVDAFYNFNIIREDHFLDDWICEAWWTKFQSIPYEYPSAMSKLISYGLSINQALEKCSVIELMGT